MTHFSLESKAAWRARDRHKVMANHLDDEMEFKNCFTNKWNFVWKRFGFVVGEGLFLNDGYFLNFN